MTDYFTEWKKLGMTPADLPHNRQSKVPGMGSDQKTARQTIPDGAPNDQAQDDPGFHTLGTGGLADFTPGITQVSECAAPAQNAGSDANKFGPSIMESQTSYDSHKSRRREDGTHSSEMFVKSTPETDMPDNNWGSGSDPLSNISKTAAKSVNGNTRTDRTIINASNVSQNTQTVTGSDASQAALIKTPGLAD